MSIRAGVLARFSSDKQRDTSCDDQIRLAREYASARDWTIAAIYRDEAISGSTPVDRRPDGARMLTDVQAGAIDVLLLESLDRLARDMVEQERIVRRLEHRGVRIIGISDGYDSAAPASIRKIQRGMRGIINEVYLDDLRAKIHRGLTGQFERGLFAGGLSYGYRSVQAGADPEAGYRLEVDQAQAPWVRFIYERYAQGWSCQRIAAELNTMRVSSPRGGTWAVGALYGSPKKGTGILNNPLYIGEYIWNRSTWVKDPDTKRRVRIERPPAEWRRRAVPELRIVPDEHWQAARARLGKPRNAGRPQRTLFSGLLRCGICGGAVVAVSKYDYGCAAHKDRGASVCCGVRAPRKLTDVVVLERVHAFLTSTATEKHLVRLARESLKRQREERRGAKTDAADRIEMLEREVTNLADAIARLGHSSALAKRLAVAEQQLAELTVRAPAQRVVVVPDLVPRLLERYRKQVATLEPGRVKNLEEARAGLHEIIEQIRLLEEDGAVYAEIGGVFGGIMAAVDGGHDSNRGSGGALYSKNRVFIKKTA